MRRTDEASSGRGSSDDRSGPTRSAGRARGRIRPWIVVLLALATLAVYGRVTDLDFISYDDRAYVADNPHVLGGLTGKGLVWAFTTTQRSNWHPLTWLSLMLDAEIGGASPRVFHLTNLLLHLINVLLLFLVLDRMTRAPWRSACVAALFAVHPLHVESVAWVAERKDVLSTLFWLIAMLAYVRYAESPSTRRYLLVALAMVLGLMAKPMLVTLPLVFLMIDFWPLRRAGWPGLVREKIPLFFIAAASSAVTFLVQRSGGAVASLDKHSPGVRLANALVSYVVYLRKTIWPSDLAFFYPHPKNTLPLWIVLGSALLLAAATFWVVRSARSRPYLAVGWLWYVVTLLPVIGLVQVGEQAMADRYTYVPLTGLFIAAVWWISDMVPSAPEKPRADRLGAGATMGSRRSERVPQGRTASSAPVGTAGKGHRAVLAVVAIVFVMPLATCAYLQVDLWRDSVTLYSHALRVTTGNATAHDFLGLALRKQGELDEAVDHFREAIRIEPGYPDAFCNLASALNVRGDRDEAAAVAGRVLARWPDNPRAHLELGIALAREGRRDDALSHLERAARLGPDLADAHLNLGVVLAELGRYEEAIAEFIEALRIDPDDPDARRFLELARKKARD